MKFNTSTLGYKLISGQLKRNRKHSEQLNKYVAGLFDADGWVSLQFTAYKSCTWLYLSSGIKLSLSTDPDGDLLRALQNFYSLGNIYYDVSTYENRSSTLSWILGTSDTRKLFNILGKHLRIKGTHFDDLCWLQESLRGVNLTTSQCNELREFSKCSRDHSLWLVHPKHPSWAWVAGYLDGDGHYRCVLNRVKLKKKENYTYISNGLSIAAIAHDKDFHILKFLQDAFRGCIHPVTGKENHLWRRNLGRESEVFALTFLKNMRKYTCLIRKYFTICKMIEFHELNKQQRLSKEQAKA